MSPVTAICALWPTWDHVCFVYGISLFDASSGNVVWDLQITTLRIWSGLDSFSGNAAPYDENPLALALLQKPISCSQLVHILITCLKQVQLHVILSTMSMSPSCDLPYPTGHCRVLCKFLVSSKPSVMRITNVGEYSPFPHSLSPSAFGTQSGCTPKPHSVVTKFLCTVLEGGLGPEQITILNKLAVCLTRFPQWRSW
jgi:hypothetical protein